MRFLHAPIPNRKSYFGAVFFLAVLYPFTAHANPGISGLYELIPISFVLIFILMWLRGNVEKVRKMEDPDYTVKEYSYFFDFLFAIFLSFIVFFIFFAVILGTGIGCIFTGLLSSSSKEIRMLYFRTGTRGLLLTLLSLIAYFSLLYFWPQHP